MTGAVDTSAEAVAELINERHEKSVESFMMAELFRDAGRDESGFATAGQYAAKMASTLRALSDERDALAVEVARLTDALISIEEYWNGADGSAVDAAEEMRHRARAALAANTKDPTP